MSSLGVRLVASTARAVSGTRRGECSVFGYGWAAHRRTVVAGDRGADGVDIASLQRYPLIRAEPCLRGTDHERPIHRAEFDSTVNVLAQERQRPRHLDEFRARGETLARQRQLMRSH